MKKVVGNDNVFKDLGFDEAEAALLKEKSDLALALRETIERQALSQTRAAELIGMSRPTLNRVLRGALHSVSMDRLITASYVLGIKRTTKHTQPRRKKAAVA